MLLHIESTANTHVRHAQQLQTTQGRRTFQEILFETIHLTEVLIAQNILPLQVFFVPHLLHRTERGAALLAFILDNWVSHQNIQLFETSERVLERLTPVETSQGIVCIVSRTTLNEHLSQRRQTGHRPCILVLDTIADPGNMGTILRTALATNVEKVLITPDCVDPYNPKTIRAAAGAHCMLVIQEDVSWAEIAACAQIHCGIHPHIYVADAHGTAFYHTCNLTEPFLLIMGNEAHGPSSQAKELATDIIAIPLANEVESLNVAVATSIILYESVRQCLLQTTQASHSSNTP